MIAVLNEYFNIISSPPLQNNQLLEEIKEVTIEGKKIKIDFTTIEWGFFADASGRIVYESRGTDFDRDYERKLGTKRWNWCCSYCAWVSVLDCAIYYCGFSILNIGIKTYVMLQNITAENSKIRNFGAFLKKVGANFQRTNMTVVVNDKLFRSMCSIRCHNLCVRVLVLTVIAFPTVFTESTWCDCALASIASASTLVPFSSIWKVQLAVRSDRHLIASELMFELDCTKIPRVKLIFRLHDSKSSFCV